MTLKDFINNKETSKFVLETNDFNKGVSISRLRMPNGGYPEELINKFINSNIEIRKPSVLWQTLGYKVSVKIL